MNFKAALIATASSFLVILLVLTLLCANSVSASNDALAVSLQEDLTLLCNALDGAESDRVIPVLTCSQATTLLYDADGAILYARESRTDTPAKEAADEATTDQVTVSERIDRSGNGAVFAARKMQDGRTLVIYTSLATFVKQFMNEFRSICLIALGLCVVEFFTIFFAVSKRQRLLNETVDTLTAIIEGDNEARVQEIPSCREQRREINYTFSRLCDRLFRHQSQEKAFSSVMNLMQHGLIAVDNDMNVMLITHVAKKLFGITGNCERMPVSQASKDVNLEDVFREAMKQGNVYTSDVAARTTGGREHRPLRLYVSPMKQDRKVVGAIAMVEDITELRRLEQVRTDFAANVSHELKTPLTSIRGYVETLSEGAIENPTIARKFLKIIMMETDRLTRLINDILSISKLESGANDVPTERIRIDQMANDVADMLTLHAGEKNVTMKFHYNEKPIMIIGNKDRVEQMLINLEENAIKYNREGGFVTVQVFSDEKNAYVSISDTGIGIAEENIPRLFERFYRVDKGRSRSMGGTGLGLAIVKHIINSMNGTIEISSKIDEGTEFLITLPLAPEGEAPEAVIANNDESISDGTVS